MLAPAAMDAADAFAAIVAGPRPERPEEVEEWSVRVREAESALRETMTGWVDHTGQVEISGTWYSADDPWLAVYANHW